MDVDAMILASRIHIDKKTGLQDAETMGRVLCEANAQVPVIASASEGLQVSLSMSTTDFSSKPTTLILFVCNSRDCAMNRCSVDDSLKLDKPGLRLASIGPSSWMHMRMSLKKWLYESLVLN